VVVFTDLDGTLLDHETYQPGPARESLIRLIEEGVSVVLCSAKTRAEQMQLQTDLGVETFSIIENGAAVVTPTETISLFGLGYREVARRLEESAEEAAVSVRGYGDMTLDEIADLTGLPIEDAERARDREYSVTFSVAGDDVHAETRLRESLGERGLNLIRGSRFWTAVGKHNRD
jgi:mannosyl-3-phosphoglycerate phosphatase family protein